MTFDFTVLFQLHQLTRECFSRYNNYSDYTNHLMSLGDDGEDVPYGYHDDGRLREF
jgi:hypothetical protein